MIIGLLVWLFLKVKKNKSGSNQLECMEDVLLSVHDAIILMDCFGTIQYVNLSAEKIIKYKLRSAKGKKIYDLFSLSDPHTRKKAKILSSFPLEYLDEQKAECFLTPITQAGIFVNLRLISLRQGKQYLVILDDLTEAQALQARLKYLETNDQLTRFLNRNSFTIELNMALNEARFKEATHIYCHLSLDQFQLINDAVGHSASDMLIRNIAQVIKDSLRNVKQYDVVRFGGDEFGILIRSCVPAEGLQWVDYIRECISVYNFSWSGINHEITASMGVVLVSRVSVNSSRIFSAADAARRVAKNKGGNKVQVFRKDDGDIQKQRAHAKWAGRLKTAFKENQFKLFAQPIHLLEEKAFQNKYNHYEVLIRLYDESNQQISPDEFIPAAEYYGMMPQIDKWVVKTVLKHLKKITQKIPLPIFSINLSGQSLDEEGFLKFVLDEIKKAEIRPQMLCFEITETVAITNVSLAMSCIKTLKNLGCSFSLDDFGTGMSSFEYLKTLPVDYLKIDGSFVKDIVTDKVQKAMVQSMNQVGHMMGLQIIAEYVENDQIIQELRKIGIDYGQGYGISRPIPLPDAIQNHYL